MSNPTDKEKVARRPTGDEQPLPTKKDTDPIIPASPAGPNRVLIVGEVGSAIIVMQLTLLALLILLLITLRSRKQAPPHLVAAFDRAFLPEEVDGGC